MKPAPLRLPLLIRLVRHGPDFLRLFARLFSDPRVPWYARMIPCLALVYLVVPLDLDWLLPIGLVDDLMIVYGSLRLFVALCPREVVREHVARIERGQ